MSRPTPDTYHGVYCRTGLKSVQTLNSSTHESTEVVLGETVLPVTLSFWGCSGQKEFRLSLMDAVIHVPTFNTFLVTCLVTFTFCNVHSYRKEGAHGSRHQRGFESPYNGVFRPFHHTTLPLSWSKPQFVRLSSRHRSDTGTYK